MPRHPRLFFLSLLSLLACLAGPAAAETKQCTPITSLPLRITTQGVYCLHQDLSSNVVAGRAITISTNNVVLDCNGHTIDGHPAGEANDAFGVMAFDRSNVTVRRCHFSGFRDGIWLRGPGIAVEHNLVEASTATGIYVYGDGGVVRGNRVLDTGGSPLGEGHAFGIRTWGDVDVLDNTVAGVRARTGSNGIATGIYADVNANGVVGENRVRGVHGDGTGATVGIRAGDASHGSIHGNRLDGPGAAGTGVQCVLGTIASGNHVSGFAVGLQSCVDGGDNVVP